MKMHIYTPAEARAAMAEMKLTDAELVSMWVAIRDVQQVEQELAEARAATSRAIDELVECRAKADGLLIRLAATEAAHLQAAEDAAKCKAQLAKARDALLKMAGRLQTMTDNEWCDHIGRYVIGSTNVEDVIREARETLAALDKPHG